MQHHELIDKIFADALTQMTNSDLASSSPEQAQEKTVESTPDEGPGSDSSTSEASEDLDALLANITAAPIADEDGIGDAELGEILTPDASDWEDSEGESVSDQALTEVINSALTIEDVPADDIDITAESADAITVSESDGYVAEEENTSAGISELLVEKSAEESIEPSADDVDAALRELGLDGDSKVLCNQFSSEKEALLKHLLNRFEMIARRKLQDLPNNNVSLVRSVNLHVDIELKFDEFSASGDDDSLFQIN